MYGQTLLFNGFNGQEHSSHDTDNRQDWGGRVS